MKHNFFLIGAAFTLIVCIATSPLAAQDQQPPGAGSEEMINVQFSNTPIPVILLEYERLTGVRVIRDSNVQDKTLSVQTSGKMTYKEAAEFIEKSFLLNGYAILPTEIPNQMKVIAYSTEKHLTSEGLPVFTEPSQLPVSDQVVTYIMPLSYLTPDAAAELFTTIIDLHPYGKITPLQNATALVVTESSSVIRRLVELRDYLDVSPVKTIDRAFDLERADAEDVAEALVEILNLDESSSTQARPNTSQPAGQTASQSRNVAATTGSSLLPSQVRGGAGFTKAASPLPRVMPIPRANRLLVMATPTDMEYICRIIEHLDAPADNSNYIRRKFRYLAVSDFLDIASNVILRGRNDAEVQESQSTSQGSSTSNQLANAGSSSQGSGTGGFGSNGSGGSGGSSGDLGDAGNDEAVAPRSIVIDKTLLIADNVQNMLIASGPPEHLKLIEELIESMDVRPVQLQISAIIAQLNLSDDFEFGVDFLRAFEAPADGNRFNGGGSFVSRTGASRSLLDLTSLTDATNLLPAAQGLSFYGQINPYLDGYLAALDSTNRFKVLSRPTVYTINNRQAVIETGQRVAVPRSTLSSLGNNQNAGNVTASIGFESVVLRISVIPLINADGEITLRIQQKNDDIIGSQLIGGDEIPTIGTQTLGTTIMVEDGGTVLLGGLISEDDRKGESGLPLFGNLPVVGRVFGSTSDRVERQELLIFVQTKIIKHSVDHQFADQDMLDRTRVGTEAIEFAENETNNIELFESQDFNSPAKRINLFKNLFRKKGPTVRAVPVSE